MINLTYNRQRIKFQDGSTHTVGRGINNSTKKEYVRKIDIHGKEWNVNTGNIFCYHA